MQEVGTQCSSESDEVGSLVDLVTGEQSEELVSDLYYEPVPSLEGDNENKQTVSRVFLPADDRSVVAPSSWVSGSNVQGLVAEEGRFSMEEPKEGVIEAVPVFADHKSAVVATTLSPRLRIVHV